jgi:hypothetical protein
MIITLKFKFQVKSFRCFATSLVHTSKAWFTLAINFAGDFVFLTYANDELTHKSLLHIIYSITLARRRKIAVRIASVNHACRLINTGRM